MAELKSAPKNEKIMKEVLKIRNFVNFVGSFSTISMMLICTFMLINSGCKMNVKSGNTTAVETVSPVDTLVVEDVVEVNNSTCDTDCECGPEETCEGCCVED